MKIYKLITLVIIAFSMQLFSQTPVTYTAGPTNAQINTMLQGNNVTITGGTLNLGVRNRQFATFTGGTATGLSMADGVYLTTGDITKDLTTTTFTLSEPVGSGGTNINAADADLSTIDATCTFDVASYSFTVTMGPKATILNIGYQFGSEEYPNFVGSIFDDAFGFFVSGPGITGTQNLARLPNGQPTSINKVNIGIPGRYSPIAGPVAAYDNTQTALYINNGHTVTLSGSRLEDNDAPTATRTAQVVAVAMSGLTKLITYSVTGLTPGGTYTFKIAIGDNNDGDYDSGVFIDQIYGTANLVAVNNTETITAGSTGTVNVLTNDTFNGASPVTLTDVSLSQVSTTNSGVNLNPTTGLITVASGTPDGVYTVTYQICDNTYSSNCKTATMTVTVLADFDGDGILNSLDLDDDNDGILDTGECGGTYVDLASINSASATTRLDPLDLSANFTTYIEGTPLNRTVTIDAPVAFGGAANIFIGSQTTGTNFQVLRFEDNTGYTANTGFTSAIHFSQPSTPTFEANAIDGASNINRADQFTLTAPVGVTWEVVSSINAVITVTGNIVTITGGAATGTAGATPFAEFNIRASAPVSLVDIEYRNLVSGSAGVLNSGRFNLSVCQDYDGDGIENYLDLDSDNDGCPDAIEGGADIKTSQLVSSAGSVSVGTGSTSGNVNLCASNTCVNAQGLPQFSPTVPTNYSNTTGQTGDIAYNSSIVSNACKCFKTGATGGTVLDTNHGITVLGRAGADNGNWPMIRKGAWTALEAKSKGFVINRIPTTAQVNAIANPEEGMMVYDEEADCLKIYTKDNDPATSYSWRCFNNQTCPDVL